MPENDHLPQAADESPAMDPTLQPRAAVGRIVLIYALFGGLWIIVSDRLLVRVVSDPEMIGHLALMKGIFFVAITSLLLYSLLRLDRRRLEQAKAAREQAARQLGESHRKLRWLEDNIPGCYVYQSSYREDGQLVFLYVSAGVEQLHQVTVAGVLQDAQALLRQVSPDQLAALIAAETDSRRTLADFDFEMRIIRPDGSSRWVHLRARPRRQPDGRVIWDGVATDVTERQRAAEILRESEERFRQMAESIDEVFWMTDAKNERMLYVSPAYEKIWGRSSADLYAVPARWMESILPEDRERVGRAVAKQDTDGFRLEYRISRPDGTIRWIYDRGFPVRDATGGVNRVVGSALDITERKNLEVQFLRAQRLEAVGTLASGVAHDLNNILAPVLMATGLLREQLTSQRDRQLVTMMETSAKRGAAIIGQLLTFSRGVEGARISVQLRHLVKDMVHLMQETFPRTIAVGQDVAPELWPVLADATQMHQVLMNLCVNARDAMPEGGRLTLRWKTSRPHRRPTCL